MRILLSSLTLVLMAAYCFSAEPSTQKRADETGHQSEGFRLRSVLLNPIQEAGSPVYVAVSLTNTTHHTLTFGESLGQEDFQVHVDRDGDGVAPTAFGKTLSEKPHVVLSQWAEEVKPGETLWYVIDVSRVCDMSLSGKYAIRISRPIPKLDGVPQEFVRPTGRLVFDEVVASLTDPPIRGGAPEEPQRGPWQPAGTPDRK